MTKHETTAAIVDWVVPVLLVVMIPVLATYWLIDRNSKERIHEAQVAACERGNVLRARINEEDAISKEVYLKAAALLRASDGNQTTQDLADVLTRGAESFVKIAIIDCPKTIP